jgi:DNA-binding winged helix-turn-helix (wHTH) protein
MLTQIAGARDCIELAHVAPFNLSEVEVLPAVRQLVRGEASETLEPRVMQVLVALARADGAVVTRDQLIDWCWDGRIVSESAINRVVSRLRQIAVEFAGGAFKLETINKVGYRLIVLPPAPKWESDSAPWKRSVSRPEEGAEPASGSRRAVLGGISAAAILAVGGVGYRLSLHQSGSARSHSAAELYRKGLQARKDGLTNLVGQAEAYFAQAVEADPQSAPAWARAGQVSWEHGADQETMAARARFAARRALQIDPGSVEAKAALALTPSMFGRWAEAEAEYRRLLMAPDVTPYAEWVLRSRLSRCLGSVGRCKEALKEFRFAASANRAHPYSSVGLKQALWNAGKVTEARAESDRALVRFPRHPDVWFARMALLTYGSRPDEAVAFGRDHTIAVSREWGRAHLQAGHDGAGAPRTQPQGD